MIAALLVLGFLALALLAFAGWYIGRVLQDRANRQLAIEERKIALEESKVKKAEPPIAIPVGLMMLAQRETEEWAKEQVKGRMRELFAECGDWDVVAQLIVQEGHSVSDPSVQ